MRIGVPKETKTLEGRVALDGFKGLAACGGFSYGDVLGAGQQTAEIALLLTLGADW